MSAPAPAPLPSSAEALAALVRKACGDACVALVLAGPALDRRAPAGRPLDSVLVLARDDLAALAELAAHAKELARMNLSPPLALTRASIASSRDSFPLELLDLAQRRRLVFGDDVFANPAIDREHIRLQCERELGVIALALRQRVIVAGGRRDGLACGDLAEDLVRVLRGLIHRDGAPAAGDDAEVIERAAAAYGFAAAPLIKAIAGPLGWDDYRAVHEIVRALGERADRGAGG